MSHTRKLLITCALPYANGSIHLGHLIEHVQADIWVRFQKMLGHDCVFICADDAHGTPIMLSAKQKNIAPEALIAQVKLEHQQDFADFLIDFDNYYTTHSEENRELSELIYHRLQQHDDIDVRVIRQAYDPIENMFLPDRYVKGECPRCGSKDQYGDSCEVCGATYAPLDLKNPISVVSGAAPIEKESEHYFFRLPKYTEFLQHWIEQPGHLQPEVRNKIGEWFVSGLQEWDISRDAPYFGFAIPGAENKYFYVWLDAPIGYMASFKNLCAQRKDLDFAAYWDKNSNAELYHFVGKDIINFHALFWPAMLHASEFRIPSAIFVHGFLTIDGQKMSKSRGTFINARAYLNHLNPEYLRYYFAAKLNSNVEDLDLSFTDFVQRINSDLVGKVVNIASRCASFIHNYFNGELSATCVNQELLTAFVTAGDSIADAFNKREFNRAIRSIMELADRANQYIDAEKPWTLIKQPGNEKHVQDVCSMGLNLFRILMIYLKPVLPHTAKNSEAFLNIAPLTWDDRKQPLLGHTIKPFIPLLQRIKEEQISALKNENAAESSHA